MKKINVIIAAAGTSQRYGKENKLFEKCGTSCVLLEATKPFLEFKEISKIIGYEDPNYFCKVFKKETGTSPKNYRTKAAIGV